MTDSSHNSPARSFGSPARSFKLYDRRVLGSPARSYCSGADYSSATESEGEDSSADTIYLAAEVPGSVDQAIINGWLKFRDNKKWRHRWAVITKLSPAAVFSRQHGV
ncbi:uncharacterized protein LOC126896550 isoform X2 [Daktulosphaira vitifoliae]|uniref:uncharacterized protein LOC126896550 isoform X2 n=1 Tax=Daktulosphaira vitifoliae TaxID=58002 RepID=UPI0021AA15A6|nr:uncharacterized protein LOC126896550 isoform X2 [Daktulosphaira vitifoliae]